jgi:hypothetical protein
MGFTNSLAGGTATFETPKQLVTMFNGVNTHSDSGWSIKYNVIHCKSVQPTNIVFMIQDSNNHQIDENIILEDSRDITFWGNTARQNKMGYGAQNIIVGDGFQFNTAGGYFQQIRLGDNCQDNNFGENCYDALFTGEMSRNNIANGFSQNRGTYFYDNVIGTKCSNNTFGDFRENTIGNFFYGNNIDVDVCYRNDFGNNCQSFVITGSFMFNGNRIDGGYNDSSEFTTIAMSGDWLDGNEEFFNNDIEAGADLQVDMTRNRVMFNRFGKNCSVRISADISTTQENVFEAHSSVWINYGSVQHCRFGRTGGNEVFVNEYHDGESIGLPAMGRWRLDYAQFQALRPNQFWDGQTYKITDMDGAQITTTVNFADIWHFNTDSRTQIWIDTLPVLDWSQETVIVKDLGNAFNVITLPDAVEYKNKLFRIKHASDAFPSMELRLTPTGGQTIDGDIDYVPILLWESVTVKSDGANWIIL